MTWLVNHTVKFGTHYAVNTTHRLGFIVMYDLDIRFVVAVVTLTVCYILDEYVFVSSSSKKPKKKIKVE